MKVVTCFLLVSLLFSIGCSSSYEVSSSPNGGSSLNAFNVEASDRNGTIVFQDGSELNVSNIIASPDSTRFLNEKTNAITVVPTHTVRGVVITNHGVGSLEGLGWGALVGSATAAVLLAVSPGVEIDSDSVVWAVLLFGGVPGAVVGGIWGAIAGHSYEYQFPTTANSTKK
jgi:hypothetical protein